MVGFWFYEEIVKNEILNYERNLIGIVKGKTMILDYVKIIIDNLKNQKNNIIQVSKVVVRDATKDSITI